MLDSNYESGSCFTSRCGTATFLLLLAIGATPRLSAQCRQGSWCVQTKTDPITETTTSNIALTVPTESNDCPGQAVITADCGGPIEALSFTIDYSSPSDKNPKFETSVPDSSILPDAEDIEAANFRELVEAGTNPDLYVAKLENGMQSLPMVQFRARIDREPVVAWSATKYSNELVLSFFDGWKRLDILGPPYGTNEMPPAEVSDLPGMPVLISHFSTGEGISARNRRRM